MPVLDCPDHAFAALGLDGGVFCFACGRAVIDDPLAGPIAVPAPAELVEEARVEWETNATVAAFGTEAQLKARGMLGSADDA
jgi:hypothetical protein